MKAQTRIRRILIVDDDVALRGLLTRRLLRSGFEIREAADAEDALREVQRRHYDLVVSDVHLPGLTGVELARLLLARTPFQPVLLITGDHDESLAREALSHGPVSYLLKPFEFFELEAAIGQALARVELHEDADPVSRSAVPAAVSNWKGTASALPPGWLELADERSGAGVGHGYRVARIAATLAAAPRLAFPAEQRPPLDLAARAHELGRILDTPPTPVGLAELTARYLADLDFDPETYHAIRHEFEEWEGTGGPDRLLGNSIPLTARILAVADTLDHVALAHESDGTPAEAAVEAAIEHVLARAGSIYCPTVCASLEDVRAAVRTLWTLARWPDLARQGMFA